MLLPNMPTKTMGGEVFWITIKSKDGWRLQQNIFTEHYRIIDKSNIRQAWSKDWHSIDQAFQVYTER